MCKKEKFYSIFLKNRRVEGQRPLYPDRSQRNLSDSKDPEGFGEPYQRAPQFLIIYFSVSSTTVSVSSGRGKGFLFLPKAKKVRLG